MTDKIAGTALLANLLRLLQAYERPEMPAATLAQLLEISGFFQSEYYLRNNADVREINMSPSLHYAQFGFKEGRIPAIWLEGARLPSSHKNATFVEYIEALARQFPYAATKKDMIVRQGSYDTAYGMPLFVNWGITGMCNYNCSYCFGHDQIDKSKFVTFGKFVNAIDNLARMNRPVYDFVLNGGEPTIQPHFFELLYLIFSKLGSRVKKIQIITNGSRNDEFYLQLKEIANLLPLSMEVSIHTDHVDPQRIYRLIDILHDSVELVFPLMFNPAKFDLVQEIFSELCILRKSHDFDMHIATLRQPPDFMTPDARYTPELREWQNESQKRFNAIARATSPISQRIKPYYPEMFIDLIKGGALHHSLCGERHLEFQQGLKNFKGMYCVCGTHMVNIWPAGKCRGIVCKAAKFIGNIFDRNLLPNTDYFTLIKCPFPSCGCRANDPLMKFGDLHEAQRYLAIMRQNQKQLGVNPIFA